MKTFLYPFLAMSMLIFLPPAYAQDAKSSLSNEWIVPLENARINARTQEKAKTFKDKKYYKNMQLVSLRSIAETQQNGVLAFHVPGDKATHQAIAQDIEAEDKSNYVWTGEMLDLPGSMSVVSEKGHINAHIAIDGKEYEIHPVEGDIHAIVELIPPKEGVETCPDRPVSKDRVKVPEEDGSTNGRQVGCTARQVRVLVLSTQDARATNIDPRGVASTAIADFNRIQSNSAVNGRINLVLAGVDVLNFRETFFNIEADLLTLADPNNNEVRRLRTRYTADLVVLLADENYNDVRGAVAAIGPDFNTAFAIVRIRDAVGAYTFAHEIGHLYGAQHEDCAMWNTIPLGVGCTPATVNTFDHGANFTRNGSLFRKTRRYHTLMHRLMGGEWSRVPNFSNPDVNYDTRATGGVEYDNAREIEIWDRTVANFDRIEPLLTVSIDGPTSVNLYESNTWEAVYGCGYNANYSFQWETSDDGFNYYSAGTSETMSRSVYNSSTGTIYIRVRVSSGRIVNTPGIFTATAYRTVYVNGSNFRRGIAQSDSAIAWNEIIELPEENNGLILDHVYPNPTKNQSQVGFYLPASETISLDIVDLSGKLMQNVTGGDFEAGSYEFNVDHSALATGVYLYHLKAGETKLFRRLVIQKE